MFRKVLLPEGSRISGQAFIEVKQEALAPAPGRVPITLKALQAAEESLL